MPSHSRRKGAQGEREIVTVARGIGLSAERTWQTAQHPDPCKRACDVQIEGQPYQVKRLARCLLWAYEPLEQGVKGVLVRADGKPWLAILPAEEYLEMLLKRAGENGTKGGSAPPIGHRETLFLLGVQIPP